jgi:hypothetical protein
MSSAIYEPGEHNSASGTRDAFGAFSDDLVAAGLPPVRVVSGDREPEVQVAIFVDRYRQQSSGPGPFGDVRYWDGSAWGYPGGTRWVRVSSAGTVAVPGTGNHEKRRSNDLGWPYNSNTPQHARAREIAQRHNITCDGIGFGEWWHWTFWGPLGSIGNPAAGGASRPATVTNHPEEEYMFEGYLMTSEHVNGGGEASGLDRWYVVPQPDRTTKRLISSEEEKLHKAVGMRAQVGVQPKAYADMFVTVG